MRKFPKSLKYTKNKLLLRYFPAGILMLSEQLDIGTHMNTTKTILSILSL